MALTLALTGCEMVYDDLSGCVWGDNATLIFTLKDGAGADLFPQTITTVDAFIFDADNRLVEHRRFEKSELDEFAGWRLSLPPGDYRVVCWGNMGSNSCFGAMTPGVTTFAQCCAEIDAAATASGDEVYYGPKKERPATQTDSDMAIYTFSVPRDGSLTHEVPLVRAHRTVNVWVQGVPYEVTVEIEQLWAQYDFFYNTTDRRVDFTQAAHGVTTADGPAQLAAFHSAFGEITDDMVITVRKASDGTVIATVNLKEFLEANPTALKDTIDILIKFYDLGVSVSVPSWVTQIITPGGEY